MVRYDISGSGFGSGSSRTVLRDGVYFGTVQFPEGSKDPYPYHTLAPNDLVYHNGVLVYGNPSYQTDLALKIAQEAQAAEIKAQAERAMQWEISQAQLFANFKPTSITAEAAARLSNVQTAEVKALDSTLTNIVNTANNKINTLMDTPVSHLEASKPIESVGKAAASMSVIMIFPIVLIIAFMYMMLKRR